MKSSMIIKAFFGIVLIGVAVGAQAGLTLASDAKTSYTIKVANPASAGEKAVAKDLAEILKEITGADFQSASGKTCFIQVGQRAPSDAEPLKEDERRIKTENNHIYLYGEGKYGNVNAVYDFLKDVLGCRWYTISGDRVIPKSRTLIVPELNLSRTPSIPFLTVSGGAVFPAAADFFRRNAILDRTDTSIGAADIHAGQRIIPSGKIPFGGKAGNTKGPFKYFKDKAYFKTNPEFFAMDRTKKRVTTMQLCYSKLELRREFYKNIRVMLDAEYQGGRAIVGVGQDDHGGAFCYCSGCKKLEEQYRHPAGAYYDFLLDLSREFNQSHPQLFFSFLAYRIDQTLRPPDLAKLPENLLPSYAPLSADFGKHLEHSSNQTGAAFFQAWAGISRKLHWWSYPTTYPRPMVSFPLTANINRMVENFRFAHQNKVWMAYCEFGAGPYATVGFNDLRLYLLSELCRRIDADVSQLIREFAENCYGAAAPEMLAYLAELEKLEAEFPYFLRWNPDIRFIRYATPDRLLRWGQAFDAMERKVSTNPRQLLNVRRARYTLDQTLLAHWPQLSPAERTAFGDLGALIARLDATVRQDIEATYATVPASRRSAVIRNRINWMYTGLEQFIAAARGGKPLPEEFAGKNVIRLLPNRNKLGLDQDRDAAFGLCNTGKMPKVKSFVTIRSFDPRKKPKWNEYDPPRPLTRRRIESAAKPDGKYRLYLLGAVKLEADSELNIHRISPTSNFFLGHLFDPSNPDRLFDLYLSLAYDAVSGKMKIDQLLVIPLDKAVSVEKQKTGRTVSDDAPDEFQ